MYRTGFFAIVLNNKSCLFSKITNSFLFKKAFRIARLYKLTVFSEIPGSYRKIRTEFPRKIRSCQRTAFQNKKKGKRGRRREDQSFSERRQRKDGRWEARITIGRNENGNQKMKYFYGKTRKEAAEKLEAYNNDIRKGIYIEPNK